jgi:hypothetical protein
MLLQCYIAFVYKTFCVEVKAKDVGGVGGTSLPLRLPLLAGRAAVAESLVAAGVAVSKAVAAEAVAEVAAAAEVAVVVAVADFGSKGVANFLCLRMIFPKSWRGLGKALSGASRGFSNNNFSPK